MARRRLITEIPTEEGNLYWVSVLGCIRADRPPSTA
jgi:hypothetical protein